MSRPFEAPFVEPTFCLVFFCCRSFIQTIGNEREIERKKEYSAKLRISISPSAAAAAAAGQLLQVVSSSDSLD